MVSREQRKSEKEFTEWMDGIQFVDKDMNIVPKVLTPDESEDPENDRGEE